MISNVLVSHFPSVSTFTVSVIHDKDDDVEDVRDFLEEAVRNYQPDESDGADALPFAESLDLSSATVTGFQAKASGGPLRRLFVRLIARRGKVSEKVADEFLSGVEADTGRPFLDWLMNGGLEKLLELILKLLPIFLMADVDSDPA